MVEESNFVAKKVAQIIEKECTFYSCTTDMWSSRHRKSFLTLTHHFLNDEFDLKTFVLEIREVQGSHTGEMIMNELKSSFDAWNLNPMLLAMMIRDSGQNIKKACREWGISYFHVLVTISI